MTDRFRTVRVTVALFLVLGIAACSAPEPGIARGEAVYGTCTPCHGADALGNESLGAPAIAGLPQWYVDGQIEKYENGTRGAHPQDLVGLRMKSMSLALDREGDRESVAEYVASLPPASFPPTLEGGDVQAGEEMYTSATEGRQACQGCHLPGAVGLEATGSPPLVGQHDWYLLSQFVKYQDGWRATDPTDQLARNMANTAMLYSEEEARNIIAYIQTLPLPTAEQPTDQ